MTTVRRIRPEETIPIRWAVLRPGFPRETAIFEGDDAPNAIHLGVFREGALVGVASIYPAAFPERPEQAGTWQLRGMATIPEVRSLGFGRALLRSCEQSAHECGGALLWCNARVRAASFYASHGWEPLGAEFDIPTVGPHFRMFREI